MPTGIAEPGSFSSIHFPPEMRMQEPNTYPQQTEKGSTRLP